MARTSTYILKLKRRREGKTDYRKRLKLLKTSLPRAVIRKTQTNIIVQFIKYEPSGDKVIASAVASELKKLGWSTHTDTVPAAYLTGLLAGKKALKKDVTGAVLDIGLNTSTKGARVFAGLKGILDAGVNVPHDKAVLPSEDRLKGMHINKELEKAIEDIKKRIVEEF